MTTPNNGIPFVPENTIDPAAGLNIALLTIDDLLQLIVETLGDDTPPVSPTDGDRYIVGTSPTGDWSGEADRLAVYVSDGDFWRFHDAKLALNKGDGALYKFISGSWTELTAAGGATELNGLSDVTITGVADGEILLYDGSAGVWVNATLPSNGAETFVDLTDTPSSYSGQGSKFVAVTAGADGLEFVNLPAIPSVLDDLDDVTITSVADGEMLAYNGSSGVWVNVPAPSGGGADTFLELTDTPAGYAGAATFVVRVNGSADGLEFFELPTIPADLDDLDDVNAPAPADGQVLTWDNANSEWVAAAPGSGATTFLQLNDTPSAYTGAAGQVATVNGAADGLEFADANDATARASADDALQLIWLGI